MGWAGLAHELMQQPRLGTQPGPSKIVLGCDWTGPKSCAVGRPTGHMAIYTLRFLQGSIHLLDPIVSDQDRQVDAEKAANNKFSSRVFLVPVSLVFFTSGFSLCP